MTKELKELLEYRADHLAFPVPADLVKQVGIEEASFYLKHRKEEIEEGEKDPLRNGFEPDIWLAVRENIADLKAKFPKGVTKIIIWGGNRSSKTRFAANYVNRDLVEHEKRRWWCCDSTEAMARTNQMRLIYEQFPPEWRHLERDEVTDVRYSLSDGFSKNKLVCPNKSEVDFKFYSMDIANLPGPELDGIWCFIAGTKIETRSGQTNIERLRISDYVRTRFGYRKIRSVMKREAKVGRVKFSNGSELVGTADHPVLTTAHGWMKLSELKYGQKVCAINASHGKGGTGIPMVGDITSAAVPRNQMSGRRYIAPYGRTNLAASLKDFIYTIKTGIDLITRSAIWNVCPAQTTCTYTSLNEERFRKDGVKQSRSKRSVQYAGLSFTGNIQRRFRSVKHAVTGKRRIEERQTENAKFAESGLSRASETSVVSVVSTWEDAGEAEVFNLRVDGEREYIANGIVVHNCDELVPLVWVETLVYRLINRNGLLLITFTPELGWNETVGFFYEGAQILEQVPAPLLPRYDASGVVTGHQEVPRVMQCQDPTARIVFFHTSDNPFGNYPALVQQLKGKSENEILIRAYGIASKSHSVAFPMFNRNAHVITQAQFREMQHEKGDRFHLVDPCDGRMWFMIWVYCPHPNKWIIYREYPSYGNKEAYIQGIGMPGPWALSGAAADGVRGDGQQSRGFSLERYIEEIQEKEMGETVLARYIDSRYATSPKSERERMTTLIEQLAEAGMDFMAMVAGKGRIIGTEANDGSVDLINSALYYDVETELGKWSKDLGRLNEPQLQVLDSCPNVIYALEHWTGMDGQKGACKDPIDCIRGAFLTGVNFIGENQYAWTGGGIPR